MMDANQFRASLTEIMPGYSWTVHRTAKGATRMVATGTQSSGSNRLSTLEVTYTSDEKGEWFSARSAGFGLKAAWLHQNGDRTLRRALRGLQDHYRHMAALYAGHERALANARQSKDAAA